ncbi:MAG TPA: phosphate ABC transporter permease subunit PstC [Actinomycetes bacterium]|jgi:phosphate transport system permease protein|nr:phosphate ABC transporter permease subunit PstC [Actinomycetes bacterium]
MADQRPAEEVTPGQPPSIAVRVAVDRRTQPERPVRGQEQVTRDAAPPPPPSLRTLRGTGGGLGDRIFRRLVTVMAVAVLALAGLLFWELFANSRPLIARDGLAFVWRNVWDVPRDLFGGRAPLLGTLISSAIAVVLAVPVALGIALFVTEIAPRWMRRPISSLVELLAAVPSVAFGFWGIVVLVPIMARHVDPVLIKLLGWTGLFRGPQFGLSLFTAGLVLAIMILPIVAAISREVFSVVPRDQREAALALGATKWESIRMAVLPYSRAGIVGAIVLGLGRAMGETMAVVFVIGNSPEISRNLLAPGVSITAQIANTFAEVSTTGHQLAALMYLALLLFFLTLIVNVAARLLVWRTSAVSGGVR